MKKAAYPAILAYGFRPFFLLAGIYAAMAVPVWILSLYGYDLLDSTRPTQTWHAHEMIFGFVAAAVAGFLLTAIPSWTGHRGFAGAPLFGLTLLWFSGRVAFTLPLGMSPLMVAMIDLAFVPVLAITILPTLIRSGNRRNLAFIGLLAVLFLANLHFHINGAMTVAPLLLGVNIILMLVTMVAGRIMPSFTAAGLRQRGLDIKIRRYPLLDKALLLTTAAILIVDILSPDTMLAAGLAIITAILYVLQLVHWQGHRTLREPLVWVLHIGYAWLPIALTLKAIWLSGIPIPATSWLHALTAGGFSTMILGVMSRAALGHTGRPLIAPRVMVLGYLLLTIAALIRVFGPILNSNAWLLMLTTAGVFWSLAFTLFVATYGPILCRPRVDGRAG